MANIEDKTKRQHERERERERVRDGGLIYAENGRRLGPDYAKAV